MATNTPFAFVGSLNLPGDQSLPPDSIPFGMTGQFSSENKQVLNLSGSGTKVFPMGTVGGAGLNGLLIKVDPSTTGQPINVVINGSADPIEISPGGFLAFGSPNPATGITTVSVTWTSAATVRIWGLGT